MNNYPSKKPEKNSDFVPARMREPRDSIVHSYRLSFFLSRINVVRVSVDN